MKKILSIITVLMLSLTPLISQITTTTLNTATNFSDFTISGTPDMPPLVVTHTTTSSLSFTLASTAAYKRISKIYSDNIITFDSIVAKFDISSLDAYNYNSVYVGNGTSTKTIKSINSNSISVTFTLSRPSNSGYGIYVNNLSVIGYKNGTSTGIKQSLDLNRTNVWVHSNKIYFKNLDDKELKMNVFNMSGQLVMEDNHPKPETELYLPNGAYFITLTDTNKNKVLTKKIIIE